MSTEQFVAMASIFLYNGIQCRQGRDREEVPGDECLPRLKNGGHT